jgi:molybdopterin-guanine dinucleotide biosynthesis protein A
MGRPKALLDWHGEPLLAAVAQTVRTGIGGGPVVVVHAAGQELPTLPGYVETVCDRVPEQGPLQGLHDGLVALAGRADRAFVATADAPLLRPELVRFVLGALGEHDAAIPVAGGRRHPLTAAYSVSVASLAATQLAQGRRRVLDFVDLLRVRLLDEADLEPVDPELRGLENVNTPAELEAARASELRSDASR